MSKVIAEQPIRYYAHRSKYYNGKKHPFIALIEKYPGEWSRGIHCFPYVMTVDLDVKSGLSFGKDHIAILNRGITLIIRDLPGDFRGPYQYLIKEMEEPEFRIPRAVEFLTLASCRYVLDCIRREQSSVKGVNLQGVVELREVDQDFSHWKISISHGHGRELDPLLIECVGLAVDKVRLVLLGREMDLLSILKRKCRKFAPEGIRRERSFFEQTIGALKRQLSGLFF